MNQIKDFYSMFKEDNIYFFGYYIPPKEWKNASDKDKNYSKKVLDFKNGNPNIIKYFAVAIKNLINDKRYWEMDLNNCLFIPVPCSKAKDKKPSNYLNDPERGIKLLQETSKMTSNIFFSELLIRKYNINESYCKDNSIKSKDQYESLDIIKHNLPQNIIILVDDIYTHGHTFNACKKILEENGHKNIWGIVLGKRKTTNNKIQN